jgi:hypothetical protein
MSLDSPMPVHKHPHWLTLAAPPPIGWSAGHSSARNGIPSEKTGRRLECPSPLGCSVAWLFNRLATVLICQRTTDTVLHSALEIRHLEFQAPFQFLEPALSRAPTSFPFRPPALNDLSRAVQRGAGSTFYLSLLSMRPASHKTAPRDYVTLHDLHDSEGNKNHRENDSLLPIPWSAPAER